VPSQLLAPQLIPAAPLQPPQGVQPPIPAIVITPPLAERTWKVQKRRLSVILEEDKATGSRRTKLEDSDLPAIKVSPGAAHLRWKFSWDKEDKRICLELLELLTNNLEMFLGDLLPPICKYDCQK
jgi:hypothetical protein